MVDPFMVLALVCVFGPFLCGLLCACPCASAITSHPLPGPAPPPAVVAATSPSPSDALPEPVVVEKPQLRYFLYSAAAATEEDGGVRGASVVVCAICLEALVGGAECSEVPACRHVFHRGCLALWIGSSNTCPLCRRPVVLGLEPLSVAEEMV
ncbi:probable E3 ubiquitin-protein ligase RHA4A [Aegilops tauschii subsp. strangulata]|uniref:probable E3 ubiquitin-protein ligase RHA4A n=1 Tax=Aegilops tauschii subsp. strangulata TaxID=200361 RepID=UPI00098B9E9E|nr:E3 ubiquitin-protein ligase EL5-like [Aegilops tauschii subsp. strangulata]